MLRYDRIAMGVLLLALVLLAFGLSAEAPLRLDLWPFGAFQAPLPLVAIAILLMGSALGVAMGYQPQGFDYPPVPFRRGSALASLLPMSLCVLLLWAVRSGAIEPVRAVLLLICGSITIAAALFAIESLARGEAFQLDSHSGIGGATGRWRLSANAIFFVLALIFLGATFAAAGADLGAAPPTAKEARAPRSISTAPRDAAAPVPVQAAS